MGWWRAELPVPGPGHASWTWASVPGPCCRDGPGRLPLKLRPQAAACSLAWLLLEEPRGLSECRSRKPGEEFGVKLPWHRCPVLPSLSAAGVIPASRTAGGASAWAAEGSQPATWRLAGRLRGSSRCSESGTGWILTRKGAVSAEQRPRRDAGSSPSPGEPQRVSEPSVLQPEPSFFRADPDLARGGQIAEDRQKHGQAGPWRADGKEGGSGTQAPRVFFLPLHLEPGRWGDRDFVLRFPG